MMAIDLAIVSLCRHVQNALHVAATTRPSFLPSLCSTIRSLFTLSPIWLRSILSCSVVSVFCFVFVRLGGGVEVGEKNEARKRLQWTKWLRPSLDREWGRAKGDERDATEVGGYYFHSSAALQRSFGSGCYDRHCEPLFNNYRCSNHNNNKYS